MISAILVCKLDYVGFLTVRKSCKCFEFDIFPVLTKIQAEKQLYIVDNHTNHLKMVSPCVCLGILHYFNIIKYMCIIPLDLFIYLFIYLFIA